MKVKTKTKKHTVKDIVPKRQQTFTVLKGTPTLYDSTTHLDQETEIVSYSTLMGRKSRSKKPDVTVVKGTVNIYDPEIHQDQERETISHYTFYQRKRGRQSVRVLKGTAIRYDSKIHHGQDSEIITYFAFVTRSANAKNASIDVLKGTATRYDPEKHHGQEIETITYSTQTKRSANSKKSPITVLKGTNVIYDPKIHQDQEIEKIKPDTFYHRQYNKQSISVLKGTTTPYDPEKHQDQQFETIPLGTLKGRNTRSNSESITVIKGTTTLYDPQIHQDKEIEIIRKTALYQRQRKEKQPQVTVLRDTTTVYDPEIHQDQETDVLPKATFDRKKKKVIVLKNTATLYDPKIHQGQETETIAPYTLRRRQEVVVLKGSATLYDQQIHHDQETEIISQRVYHRRRKQITVLKGTSILYDPLIHDGEEVETISQDRLCKRKKKCTVLKGTDIIYDPDIHSDQETETISEHARYKRLKSNDKKRKIGESETRDQEVAALTLNNNTEQTSEILLPDDNNNLIETLNIKQEKDIMQEDSFQSSSLNPLRFDELHNAITVLRGSSSAQTNCVHLAINMLQFIQTRKIPSELSDETLVSLDDFRTLIMTQLVTVPLKSEDGKIIKKRKLTQITESVADRNTLFFKKIPIRYQQQPYSSSERHFDLTQPEVVDLENYCQTKIHYKNIIKFLKDKATQEASHEYFGVVNFGFSGSKNLNYGHMIVFYATPDNVYFVDGQFINEGKEEKPPVFQDLATHYLFADKAVQSSTQPTLSCDVFIMPVSKNLLLENVFPAQNKTLSYS